MKHSKICYFNDFDFGLLVKHFGIEKTQLYHHLMMQLWRYRNTCRMNNKSVKYKIKRHLAVFKQHSYINISIQLTTKVDEYCYFEF